MALILYGLEKALNNYVRLDTDTIQRLSKLEKKVIKVQIPDWNINFFIIPYKNGIRLLTSTNTKIDTVISGSLFSLFRAVYAKSKKSISFKNSIEISGDIEVGEKIHQIIVEMDIDWEEHLSKLTGDIIAHHIGMSVRRTISFSKYTTELLCKNLKAYLQAEAQLVPSLNEVSSFNESVALLQHAVERSEKRIQQLAIKIKSSI